jgi:hypothetical protein
MIVSASDALLIKFINIDITLSISVEPVVLAN